MPEANDSSTKERRGAAKEFVTALLSCQMLETHGEAGSVPWLFSHLKLTMHAQLFTLKDELKEIQLPSDRYKWATAEEVEAESMGTGMRKCWALIQNAGKWSK